MKQGTETTKEKPAQFNIAHTQWAIAASHIDVGTQEGSQQNKLAVDRK